MKTNLFRPLIFIAALIIMVVGGTCISNKSNSNGLLQYILKQKASGNLNFVSAKTAQEKLKEDAPIPDSVIYKEYTKKMSSIAYENRNKPYIIYNGEKFYYCCMDYHNDTVVSPDGSLQIFISKRVIYNHFDCKDIYQNRSVEWK